ncbi:MAG: hypothetical protein V1709_09655, partial [Planctomycetota bacterium]
DIRVQDIDELFDACLADNNIKDGNDGLVNNQDAAIFADQYESHKSCTGITPPLPCMDFNADGKLDSADVARFASFYSPNDVPFNTPEEMQAWCGAYE